MVSCLLKGMWIYISPCVLATSIQNPIPCEACFIHQQNVAEEIWRCYNLLQYPFAESFSTLKIQQLLQSLNMPCMEWTQQLIMQGPPHHHSLEMWWWDVNCMVSDLRDSSMACRTSSSTLAFLRLHGLLVFDTVSNIQHVHSTGMNVLQFGCCHCRYLSSYTCAAAALLCSASLYGNFVSTNSLNEYSAFCTIVFIHNVSTVVNTKPEQQ